VGRSQRRRLAQSLQGVPFRAGRRICLLKGCEQSFQPGHPLSRYCGSGCREAARRWSRRTANRRYRASEQGKSRRREQSSRYRERARERERGELEPAASDEGYHHPSGAGNSFCQRPGCYERFNLTARSPLQKFCSSPCANALRRVLIRERRWKLRRRLERTSGWRADDSW
jgi:hypothetical protein